MRAPTFSEIVTGALEYGMDIRVPGMVYASIERGPVLGAKLLGERAEEPHTSTGVRVMSPAYAAPEQILGEPVHDAEKPGEGIRQRPVEVEDGEPVRRQADPGFRIPAP